MKNANKKSFYFQLKISLIFIPIILFSLLLLIKSSKHCYLEYVPLKYRDLPMCMLAYEKNKSNIAYFPKELQTKKLWNDAIPENGCLMSSIPKKYIDDQTYVLCKYALHAILYSNKKAEEEKKREYDLVVQSFPENMRYKIMADVDLQINYSPACSQL